MSTEPRTPPYGDRKQSADPVEPGGTEVAGADVGGARHHRTSDPASVEETAGTGTSPAREEPAEQVDGDGQEDPGTGPAHTPGVARGEDRRG
jgi:hypothetical protein